MLELFKEITNPQSIIQYGGFWLLLFVIFAETGLFFGFFLPGDNLVFITGLLSATKPELLSYSFPVCIIMMITAAVLGNMVGYWFGKKAGNKLYDRKDSFFFRQSHLATTKTYYGKHGGITLIFGRFLPIIRTFAPILAGVINVETKKFMLYNVVGAVLWITSIGCIGFYLGKEFPQVENYLGWIFIGLIILTSLPIIGAYLKSKKKKI